MAYSYVRYTGNGSTQNYVFPFPYIDATHVKVRLDGVLNTSFSFLNASTIRFNTAPASGVVIEIRRETPKDSPIVNFTDGSILLERDLDLLATFDTYVAQETQDTLDESITKDSLGVWDAKSARMGNLADPVNAQDAASKNYVDVGVIATITPSVNAAAASAAASAASATASAGSATAAASSQTAAAASAVSAANSAAAAATALDNFDDRYLGAKAADPSVDNDGDPLIVGALYSNTVSSRMRFYTGSGWVDASSAFVASLINYEYVATAGQTVFSGADANGLSMSYSIGNLIVSLNGLVLRDGNDFTATNGTSLTLVTPCAAGDELQVHAFGQFQVADVYTKAQADLRYVQPSAIGVSVQAYDANTVKKNVATGYTAQQYGVEATLTDAATVAWDVSAAQVAKVTLAGNRTFGAPTNQIAGAYYGLLVIQDATGSRTGAWNSVFKFPTATAPTLTTTANAKDFFVFRSDGTNMNLVGKSQDVR